MGCWNQTCGLSQLHIRANQDVVVFALVKNNGVDSLCYTTPFYAPVMMPFYAKYNDYGGAEDCTGLGVNLVMNAIKEDLVELPMGANQYHDIPVKREGFDTDVFFEAVHESRLFIKGRFDRQRQHVGFMMIHKDVFDHVIENRVVERYVGANNGTTGWDNAYINITFADVEKDVAACAEHLFESGKKDLFRFDPLRGLRTLNEGKEKAQVNTAAQWLAHDEYRYSSLVRPSLMVSDYIEANDRAGLTEMLTEYLKAMWIDGFMMDTRKFWSPQSGAGSQQQEPEGYLLLIDAMKKVLDAEKRKYEEDYND
jgi:hypothetical protein